jgi:hypothetical protein
MYERTGHDPQNLVLAAFKVMGAFSPLKVLQYDPDVARRTSLRTINITIVTLGRAWMWETMNGGDFVVVSSPIAGKHSYGDQCMDA